MTFTGPNGSLTGTKSLLSGDIGAVVAADTKIDIPGFTLKYWATAGVNAQGSVSMGGVFGEIKRMFAGGDDESNEKADRPSDEGKNAATSDHDGADRVSEGNNE